MTSEGHLLFSVSCAIFAKNIELTSTLTQGDWWHIVPAAISTCFLPDIDHPKSLLGSRLKWISRPASRVFRHRGLTHSPISVMFITLVFSYFAVCGKWMFQPDVIQGMIIGYTSHIVADILTPSGVPILWPCRLRFRLPILVHKRGRTPERIFCSVFLILAICIPKITALVDLSYWSLQIVHFLKMKFDSSFIIRSVLKKIHIYYDFLITVRKYSMSYWRN